MNASIYSLICFKTKNSNQESHWLNSRCSQFIPIWFLIIFSIFSLAQNTQPLTCALFHFFVTHSFIHSYSKWFYFMPGIQQIFIFYYLFYFPFRATPMAYGGSQARDLIRAVAASLHQSHSNSGSQPHLWPTPQQCRIFNPLSEARDRTCIVMVPNQVR